MPIKSELPSKHIVLLLPRRSGCGKLRVEGLRLFCSSLSIKQQVLLIAESDEWKVETPAMTAFPLLIPWLTYRGWEK